MVLDGCKLYLTKKNGCRVASLAHGGTTTERAAARRTPRFFVLSITCESGRVQRQKFRNYPPLTLSSCSKRERERERERDYEQ